MKLVFRRYLREWDRITNLIFLTIYALYSLIDQPVVGLRVQDVSPFFVSLLLYELLAGCFFAALGIATNLHRLQMAGAILLVGAIGIQVCISVFTDGLTPGDFLVAALMMTTVSLKRRLQWKKDTVRNIQEIHAIVDESLRSIATETDRGQKGSSA